MYVLTPLPLVCRSSSAVAGQLLHLLLITKYATNLLLLQSIRINQISGGVSDTLVATAGPAAPDAHVPHEGRRLPRAALAPVYVEVHQLFHQVHDEEAAARQQRAEREVEVTQPALRWKRRKRRLGLWILDTWNCV